MAERRYYNDIAKDQIHGKEDIKTGTGAASTPFVEGGSNAVSASFFYGDGSQLTGVGGAGISWDGSTSNGVATYKNASEATVEANLTFDGSTLNVAGDVEADGLTVDSADVITLETSNAGVNAISINSTNIFFSGGDEDGYYGFFSKPLYLPNIADPTYPNGKLWVHPVTQLNWTANLEVGGTITAEGTVQNNLQVGSHRQVIAVDQDIRFADSANDTVIVEVDIKIPARAIITMVSAGVKTLSNLGTHKVNIQMSATHGTAADSTISSGTELLGAGAIGTMSTDSASASDIVLGSSDPLNDVWLRHVAVRNTTSDQYIYICNAGTGNGTTNSEAGTLSVVVEYYGMD